MILTMLSGGICCLFCFYIAEGVALTQAITTRVGPEPIALLGQQSTRWSPLRVSKLPRGAMLNN